jgi:hypothetical protein
MTANETATVKQPLGYARLIKYTGRNRLVCGTEYPIYHLLTGSSRLGYTIAVDVCQDIPFHAAAEYLAQLPGDEIEDMR